MEILQAFHRLDLRVFTSIFRHSSRPALATAAKAVSRSGDGYLHLLIPLVMFLLDVPLLGEFALLLVVAISVERCVYWALKNSLKRQRPHDFIPDIKSLVVASDKFSFPSGHTSAAFLLATSLVVVYGGPVTALYLWAAGVALSRVLLGVHYPGDTLAGAFIGSSIALGVASWIGLA